MNCLKMFKDLETILCLRRIPVGIKIIKTKEEYDKEEIDTIKGIVPYCTLVRNATEGKRCKINLENFACLSSARALGILKNEEHIKSGKAHYDMKLYDTLEISKEVNDDMVYIEEENYGVVIKPLYEYEDDNPDIVIIISNPYNMMRIVQGNGYYFGQSKNIKLTGLQAICQESTSYPIINNQINISLLCSGTRKVSQWKDDEMSIGIPFNKLETIIEGIKKTVNPMEPDNKKKEIERKQSTKEIIKIKFKDNYYKKSYRGLKK